MHRDSAMSHKPVTHSRPIPMPKHSGLLKRKGRFYLNVRVPKELRAAYGKQEIIRKSLGTSDPREAISRLRYEAFKLDSEFKAKQRELGKVEPPPTVLAISDREAHDLVFRWLIDQEKLSQDWWDKEGSSKTSPVQSSVTVGKMVERFLKYLIAAKRSDKTLRTYKIPCRLLCEELGEKTVVESITKEQMEELYGLLRHAPSNVVQRYRGLTLKQAVKVADKNGDTKRLSAKSLDNYRVNIEAIFNFAVEEEFIAKNPAKGRTLRALMEGGEPPKPKAHFTVDEMNRLFRVFPFELDGDKKGDRRKNAKKTLQKGRAWVCVLSLFHGFRCNEVAQLYTEDVKKEDGIPFIEIRKEREDGSESDKRIKTKQSKRRVPIHPEILKMGFLSFVEQRKGDASSHRLFPDLPRGASGYYSDPFSKWFAGFVEKTLGEKCRATFHSFRHQFRDALREAGVSTEDAERLGGWEVGMHSAEREYGHGPSLKRLRQQIQKVKFPNLDLRHLYRV
jgi:integrase